LTQDLYTTNTSRVADISELPRQGRLLALDPGTKRVGVAISDETQTVARPLERIERTSWKRLLEKVRTIVSEFDAVGLVIGLPLESDGTESPMSAEARDMARKFSLSLDIPVVVEDERVTSYAAKSRLWERGFSIEESRRLVDSEAAAIILSDVLERLRAERP